MNGNHVLNIEGMVKRMRSGGSEFVLEVPALAIERGRFYGLVGRSGSGKSTMLDLLAMVARPTEVSAYTLHVRGEVIDLSRIVRSDSDGEISRIRLSHFGYILQSGGLFSFLTVRENLRLPFMMSGRAVDEDLIERLVSIYDMGDQLDKKPSGLSGGQRQRVSVLRSLCLNPDIILADEPTASVDENMAEVIVGELKRLARDRGATVIMVSHDVDLVNAFADEVVSLKPEIMGDGVTRSVVRLGERAA